MTETEPRLNPIDLDVAITNTIRWASIGALFGLTATVVAWLQRREENAW